MFHKVYWVSTILGIACMIMGADSAFAQKGGGGRGGGGGHSSGGRGGPAHSGGHGGVHMGGGHIHGGNNHYGHNHYGHNHYGYNRSSFSFGGYGGSYYGGGLYFGSSYPYYDSYTYPRYNYYDAPAVQYYRPATEYYVQPAPMVLDQGYIRVLVPDPNAQVLFDGNPTKQNGTDRLFNTPSLTPGSNYTYRIRASWTQAGQPMVQEQEVKVTPGKTTVADFTR